MVNLPLIALEIMKGKLLCYDWTFQVNITEKKAV